MIFLDEDDFLEQPLSDWDQLTVDYRESFIKPELQCIGM